MLGWVLSFNLTGVNVTADTKTYRTIPLPLVSLNGKQVNPDPRQPSCATCPAAMNSSETSRRIGKSIGSPTCALRTLPIIRPNQPLDVQLNVVKHRGKTCESFGTEVGTYSDAAFSAPLEYQVALPMPNHDGVEEKADAVTHCASCANFVPASKVIAETGWNVPMCVAKGILLLDDRLATYAKDCDDRKLRVAQHPAEIDTVVWNPEFTLNFGKPDPTKQALRNLGTDPQDWPTDRPVTDADAERGIKSWRRLVDPIGYGEEIFLPIYDSTRFGDRAALIPRTGDDEHPEDYIDYGGFVYQLFALWTLEMTPGIWGPPGVGKTELMRHAAWLMGLPFARISITGQTEIDDLAGKMHYTPDRGMFWVDGRLPRNWRLPGVICLDEPNVGPPDVWQFIRPLTDNSKQLVLDQNNGELVPKDRDCYFALAMNPAWDHRNVGAQQIGAADARRLMHVWIGMPPSDIEEKIILRRCNKAGIDPSKHLRNLLKISDDIRNCDGLAASWGVADNIKVAQAMKFFPPLVAYQIAVTNYLDPDSANIIADFVRSVYPDS